MFRKRKALHSAFAFLLAFISVGFSAFGDDPVLAAPPAEDAFISGFENENEGWTFSPGSEFPGAKGGFERDPEDFKSGGYSGKMTGNFEEGGAYVAISKNLESLDMQKLRFWVKTSDLSGIRLRVTDTTGQVHQQVLPLQDTADWQQVSVSRFDGGTVSGHWGGANDGVFHSPATGIAILMDRAELSGGKTSGEVRIDDVTARVPIPALAIRQAQLGNVFAGDETPAFHIVTYGDAVSWMVQDIWGHQVAQGKQAVNDGSAELRVPLDKKGYFLLQVTAEQAGNPLETAETSFAVLPSFDTGQTADSPFGFSTHFGQSWNPELIPLLQKAGAKNIRDELYWGNIETQKGVYTFPQQYDTYMNVLKNHGIDPFIIFSYINPFYDENSTPYTDEGRQGFARYGREIVKHYGDQIKWVEVYNEFNIHFGDVGNGEADSRPDSYFKLLKETYQAVKAHDPDVTVVGPATAGVPFDWIEEVFQLGGLQYMDAVSIHPYRYPDTPEGLVQDLVRLQDLIKKYNDGQTKPIWITEIGWPTQLDNRGVSEKTQADYIVRSHVLALSQGVGKMFWYDFMNDGTDDAYNEHNFGIIRNPGDPKGKYTPKPAYAAYSVMTRELAGAAFSVKEDINDKISSYKFTRGNEEIRVVWATEPQHVTIRANHPVTVTDMMGNAETLYPVQQEIYLTVSQDPIYIRGDVKNIAEGSRFALQSGHAVTGDTITLALNVDNTLKPPAAISATFEVEGRSYPVSAKPHEKKEVQIQIPGTDKAESITVFGLIRVKGKPAGKLAAEVTITDPVRVQAKHILKNNADVLQVHIQNVSSRDYSLQKLHWEIGDQTGVLEAQLTIPASSSTNVELPVPAVAAGQSYPVTLTLHSENEPSVVYKGKLVLVDQNVFKTFAEKTITVDGTLDDLAADSSIDIASEGTVQIPDYSGAEDLSGSVWVTWDRDNLYISAKIRDDAFSQTSTADGIWTGDSIQFAAASGTPGERTDWYEYGIALTKEGPQVYRWIAGSGQPIGLVDHAELAVKRDDSSMETVYELALPWQELTPVLPDDGILSFSFLVNDNDGQGRKGWIEWGGGIATSKDPAAFKPVRLIPKTQ